MLRPLILSVSVALLVFAPRLARADGHPAYLHALGDLRDARAYVARPARYNGSARWDEKRAQYQIDEAIREIKGAGIDDDKDKDDHVSIDGGMEWSARLTSAKEILQAMHADIEKREDDDRKGLRDRVFQHVDGALTEIDEGLRRM